MSPEKRTNRKNRVFFAKNLQNYEFLVFRQKLVKIEGFRASRRSHEILLEILHRMHLTRAPEALSKPRIIRDRGLHP